MFEHSINPELPDPAIARKKRQQEIALAVVSKGDKRGVRTAYARSQGISTMEVTRAMVAEGDWARKRVADQAEGEK